MTSSRSRTAGARTTGPVPSATPRTRGPLAGGTSQPAPGHGAPPWRRAVPLLAAALVGAALASTVWAVATRPDESEQVVSQLAAADVARDVERVEDLTALARQVQEDLAPVLEGLAVSLPVGQAPAAPAEAAAVASWQGAAADAATSFDDPLSAGTSVNVAHGSFASATDQLQVATDTYAQALAVAGEEQQRLLELAARQRAGAVVTWSVGATQLDFVSIEAGFGHVHVFLASGDGTGALSPDPAPEGEGAHDDPEGEG